jgi:hypothetical protein
VHRPPASAVVWVKRVEDSTTKSIAEVPKGLRDDAKRTMAMFDFCVSFLAQSHFRLNYRQKLSWPRGTNGSDIGDNDEEIEETNTTRQLIEYFQPRF